MLELLGARRLRLDRGRHREPDRGGPRGARQALPPGHRGPGRAAVHGAPARAVRAGQPDRHGAGRRRRWSRYWRDRLIAGGVWANEPVPLYPYPGSPDYRALWGEPDDEAWERAHAALPRCIHRIQRHPGRASRAAGGTGGSMLRAREPTAARPDDDRRGRRRVALRRRPGARPRRRRASRACWSAAVRHPMRRSRRNAAASAMSRCSGRGLPLDWMAADDSGARRRRRHAARDRRATGDADLLHLNLPSQAASIRRRHAGGRRVAFLRRDLVARRAAAATAAGLALAADADRPRACGAPTWCMAPTRSHGDALRSAYGPLAHAARRRTMPPIGRTAPPMPASRSCLRPAAGGTRARMPRRSMPPPASSRWPVRRWRARSMARTAQTVALQHADALGRAAARRRLRALMRRAADLRLARAATSRSASPCWRRRRAAARWCSPTSRPSASCGTARRCSSQPDDAAGFAAAIDRLADGCRRCAAALGERARDARRASSRLARQVGAGPAGLCRGARDAAQLRGGVSAACASFFTPTRWSPTGTTATRISCAACCANCRRAGTTTLALEPEDGWSRAQPAARRRARRRSTRFHRDFPELTRRAPTAPSSTTRPPSTTPMWCSCTNGPTRRWSRGSAGSGGSGGRFTLLFHDTHHRAVSDAAAIADLALAGLRRACWRSARCCAQRYLRRGWGRQVFTWHEAADTRLFRPQPRADRAERTWCGSATGATASARRSCANS